MKPKEEDNRNCMDEDGDQRVASPFFAKGSVPFFASPFFY